MAEAEKRKRGRPKKTMHKTVDTIIKRDSLGRFVEGIPTGTMIYQKRIDDLLDKVTELHRRIDREQGDPMEYLTRCVSSLAPLTTVLEAVGVTSRTRQNWIREIEEGTSPRVPALQEFFTLLERQRAAALIDVLLKLKEHGFENSRAWYSLSWLIERTHQDQFLARKEKALPQQTNVQVNVDITAKTALEQAEVAAVAYRQRQLSSENGQTATVIEESNG